ncbi:MAG: hypothetical protein JSC189_000792 [Candidatus Tokpelaia sp. JSC189]|nr:MAG: hypothetical protein JSC189_000792 [Candidatus Tokpelaia sp. JSC189]
MSDGHATSSCCCYFGCALLEILGHNLIGFFFDIYGFFFCLVGFQDNSHCMILSFVISYISIQKTVAENFSAFGILHDLH